MSRERSPSIPGSLIALCAVALLTFGVVMVNSAGMSMKPTKLADGTFIAPAVSATSILFSRTTVYMVLAIGTMLLASRLPVRRLLSLTQSEDSMIPDYRSGRWGIFDFKYAAFAAIAIVFVLLLAYVPGIGKSVNGSHRWLRLPIPGIGDALSVQPSEIAKWAMVFIVAWFATRRLSIIPSFYRGLLPALCLLGSVCFVIILEDLGTGVLVLATGCIILLAAGARLWQFAMFIPLALMGLFAAIVTSPYRVARITAFLDPYQDSEKTGYHMIQSMLAVAGGEGFGRGLGFGLQKFGYLPEDTTDFLFAIICEELGIAGAAIIIVLFVVIICMGCAIVIRERSTMLRLVALGIVSTIGLQAIINLIVVTGLGPTKGIALPLVSSGGTGWLLTCFSIGILMAIDRTQAAYEPALGASATPAPSELPLVVPSAI